MEPQLRGYGGGWSLLIGLVRRWWFPGSNQPQEQCRPIFYDDLVLKRTSELSIFPCDFTSHTYCREPQLQIAKSTSHGRRAFFCRFKACLLGLFSYCPLNYLLFFPPSLITNASHFPFLVQGWSGGDNQVSVLACTKYVQYRYVSLVETLLIIHLPGLFSSAITPYCSWCSGTLPPPAEFHKAPGFVDLAWRQIKPWRDGWQDWIDLDRVVAGPFRPLCGYRRRSIVQCCTYTNDGCPKACKHKYHIKIDVAKRDIELG